jgi:signal peptidase II
MEVILLFLADFITKRIFESVNLTIIPGILNFQFVKNTGISFGMFQGYNFLFIIISIIFFILLYKYKQEINKFSFILLSAGVLGNLSDRILYGGVTDFISFSFFPTFNLADSYLTIGVLWLIIEEIKHKNAV